MKLAEALILRADLQNRIQLLRTRLMQSATVQEGDAPPEDPATLLADVDSSITELQSLVARINATNATALLPDGRSLTQALAARDALKLRRSVLQSVVEATSLTGPRYSKSEVRFLRTVDVPALQRQLDALARELRELDTAIQATNWSLDLV
jgi:hypothetical protein